MTFFQMLKTDKDQSKFGDAVVVYVGGVAASVCCMMVLPQYPWAE